jgi:hypothetical protein
MTMKLRHTTALLLAALLAGACSDSTGNDDGPPRPGAFRGTLSGFVTGEARGKATLVGSLVPTSGHGVYLIDDRDPDRITRLYLQLMTRPAPGTYPVHRMTVDTFGGQLDVLDAARGETVLATESGTVTIEESTAQVLRGSYDVSARSSADLGPVQTIRATGTFHAIRQDID